MNQKKNDKTFFILGSGRCGSTLLRTILIKSTQIHIPPESAGLPGTIKKFYRYQGLHWKDLVNVCVGEFASYGAFKFWHLDADKIVNQLYDTPKPNQSLQTIINTIFINHQEINKPTAEIWGDKTTFNTLRLNWINKVYPNAKYINLIRDGRDVLNSYLKSGLESDVDYIIWKWNESLIRSRKFEKKYKNYSNFLNIYYEDLVTNPDTKTKEVMNFLNISLKSMSLPNKVINDDLKLNHHSNVSNPINTKSIGNWKSDLNQNMIEKANIMMKENLQYYNYI